MSTPATPKELVENEICELIIPTELLSVSESVSEGAIVKALAYPWLRIVEQLTTNPELFTHFSSEPFAFEEFVAASWDKAGYKVTLTPRSGDGGKDIIAEKIGVGAFRIIDQCKAFKKGRKVSVNDVRAMMGTLMLNSDSKKAYVSTTSLFAPSAHKEWKDYIPNQLELREGPDLIKWLESLRTKKP